MLSKRYELWVLYLAGKDQEVPVLVGGGAPPGKALLEEEAARARAALGLSGAASRLRVLPLLCYRGVLYLPRPLMLPAQGDCVRQQLVPPGKLVRLY